jgi:hypothetical protein
VSAPRFKPGRLLRKLSYAVTLIYDDRGLFVGGRFLPSRFLVYVPLKWLERQVIRGRVRAAVALPLEPPEPWPKAPPPGEKAASCPRCYHAKHPVGCCKHQYGPLDNRVNCSCREGGEEAPDAGTDPRPDVRG